MTNTSGPIVYVDADACPVKDEVTTVAIRHGCRAVMVCNGGIRPHPHPLVDLAIVDDGPDAADIWIADHAGPSDVVVTSDIPLAARAVGNGAAVLRPDGSPVSADNVGNVLATRDLMTDMRWTSWCRAVRPPRRRQSLTTRPIENYSRQDGRLHRPPRR